MVAEARAKSVKRFWRWLCWLYAPAKREPRLVSYQQVVIKRYCMGHGALVVPMQLSPVNQMSPTAVFYSWKCALCKAEVSATVEEYATVTKGKPN